QRPGGRGGGGRARGGAGPRLLPRGRPLHRQGRQPQHLRGRLRAGGRRGVRPRGYAHLVRRRQLPRDPAAPHPRGGAGGPVPAIRAGQGLPRHRGRPRLGCPPGERDERQRPAPRRALDRLDPSPGTLPRAHPGGRPGRLVPPGGLGGRDHRRHHAPHGQPVSPSELLAFLRRELAPTPGRAGATLRLTLACLAGTPPLPIHPIPHALVVMILMYLVTQEDAAATVFGSILGALGATLGVVLALLAWAVCLDTPWLRVCFFAAFFFGGLFLKRALTIGPLGSA